MNHREALEKSFRELAPFSDKQRWEFHGFLAELKYVTANFRQDDEILDAGCGIGVLALALKFLGYDVEGADKYTFVGGNRYFVDDRAGLEAIWRQHGLKVLHKDFLSDELDKKYDVVLSNATIEHQISPRKFIAGLKGCLKDGGRLFVTTPNMALLLNRLRLLFGRTPLWHNLRPYFDEAEAYNGHWREFSLDEVKLFFEWSGFEVEKAKYFMYLSPFRRPKNPRDVMLGLLRLPAYVLPSLGDNMVVIGKLKKTP